jgi:hypothetical protein
MSTHNDTANAAPPLDLSKWRNVPDVLMVLGGIGAIAGCLRNSHQLGFSWLLAFMFFLSICLGSLGLVILHHLFDASWSVPIRRVCEQLACLSKWMIVLFIPIAILAPHMYQWMTNIEKHIPDMAADAKKPLFTFAGFYIVSAVCLLSWWFLSNRLRYWSLKQDETGGVDCTRQMRRYAAFGVFIYAITLTLGAIMWVKALQHEWFSTMYGVYYFAGSMWLTLATVYVITLLLKRQGPLKGLVHEKTFYFIGSLLFAFTVFYAYVTFAQYFIIWNANMPEETFWYVLREKGTWWYLGLVIIFGHFFLPFLLLLRIDFKLKLAVMGPLFVWAWLMHFTDMSFNIVPVLHPENFKLHWMDLACMMFIGGLLTKLFVKQLNSAPIVPQKDPRFAESQDIYVEPVSMAGAKAKTGGGH